MTSKDKARYDALCREIWHHNQRYFVDHAPDISDEVFDQLVLELRDLEAAHPEWVGKHSPSQRVNETLTSGFQTVVHAVPMLSLANVYALDELRDFMVRMKKLTGREQLAYSNELKMDGIAISALYEDGMFTRGVTRGDGKQGDDITANLRTIKNLPKRLEGEKLPQRLEVRGEVFMPKAVFAQTNAARAKQGEPMWANPRNAAAGSLKLLDSAQCAQRHLDVVFYAVADERVMPQRSQFASHAWMASLGLPVLAQHTLTHSFEETCAFLMQIETLRPELPFEIDGVVVKLDDIAEQKRLGNTGKNPRWAVAFKFASKQAVTRIREISVQVGRTGVLTPVAELEPVPLAGSTISRATLHNEDEVQRKDIRVGDWVVIEKGGDVIPKVTKVVEDRRHGETSPWSMPKQCPSCGAAVIRPPGEVAVRCPNSAHCPEQKLRHLIFFAGKDAFDIENLGEKVVTQLVSKGFVNTAADFFALTEAQLAQLAGFKEKSVQNLLRSLNKARHVTLPRLIMGLGIRHIGTETAEVLAEQFGTIQALQGATREQLMRVEGIGDTVATALLDFFADATHRKELQRLLDSGLEISAVAKKVETGHPFSGKTFVLTGTLQGMTRDEAAAMIKECGGKVSGSLSQKTHFLVVGESPGSKLDKAKQLGVTCLSEAQFLQALAGDF
jgi:DNA ligase (NAD+)